MEYWMWFPYLHLITWQLKISACCWMVVVRWTYNSWRATLVLTTRLEVWNERDDVTSYHNMFVMLFVAMLSWCDVMEYKVMLEVWFDVVQRHVELSRMTWFTMWHHVVSWATLDSMRWEISESNSQIARGLVIWSEVSFQGTGCYWVK